MKKTILIKKSLRDIKKQIRQYLAVILIAAFSVCLFVGLAANYRTLSDRKNRLYQNGNIADLFISTIPSFNNEDGIKYLDNNDISNIKTNDIFKNLELEKRLVIPSIINPVISEKYSNEEKKNQSQITGIYDIILNNKNNKINKIIEIFDHNKNKINNQEIKSDGIYLPLRAYQTNVKIGDELEINLSLKLFMEIIKNKFNFIFEKNDQGNYTGVILNQKTKNELKVIDILKAIKKENDPKIRSILNSFFISDEQVINYGFIQFYLKILIPDSYLLNTNNNLFSKANFIKLIEKLDGKESNLKVKTKLLGYVMQPEAVDATSERRYAFTNYNYFLNKIKNEINTKFKNEITIFYTLLNLVFGFDQNKDKFIPKFKNNLLTYYQNDIFTHFDNFRSNYIIKTEADKVKLNLLFESINSKVEKARNEKVSNQILIKINDKHKNKKLQEFKTYLLKYFKNKSLKVLYISDNTEVFSNITITSDILQSYQLMLVFPIIFFIVAFLVIIATNLQIVLRERSQIGAMKAMGFSNNRIYTHYIGRTMLICGSGVFTGAIAGPFIFPAVLDNKYKYLYNLPKIKYIFPFLEVITILLFFNLILALIMYLVCRHEVNLMPAKSLRPKNKKINLKKSKFKIIIKNIASKIALRNIKINVFRSFMAIVGVMGCTALLLGGMGIGDTIKHGIKKDMDKYYQCDIVAVYAGGSNPIEEIKKIKGVNPDRVENYFLSIGTAENPKTGKTMNSQILSISDKSKFIDLKKYPNPKHGECFVPKKIARNLKLKKGDYITFTTNENISKTLKIGKIINTFAVQGIIFSTEDKIVSDLKNIPYACYIDVLPEYKNKQLEVDKEIKKANNIAFTVTKNQVNNVLKDVSSSISILTNTILIFAILLSITVLYNLSRLNLDERKREIATLKVLGFTNSEIGTSILVETLFLTIIGTVLGALLGFPMLVLILKINETQVLSFLYYIKWESYVIGIFASIFVAFIINFYMTRITKKIKMVESLKSVE